LPDVEVFKRYVDATLLHQKIRSVEVRNEKILGGVSAHRLQGTMKGRTFESTRRHGKYLFVRLDDDSWLLLHFGMTGSLEYFKDMDRDPPHDRLLISFENHYHLALDDARMFGKVDLIEDPNAFIREKKLGPDPLELEAGSFRERFQERRGGVKAALMNQRIVAGIGNIYSDEILFQARLHPLASVEHLDSQALDALHKETHRVLKTAIERGASPQRLPGNFLLSHRREGKGCPRENGEIRKTKAAGRTAYYCPACQPEEVTVGYERGDQKMARKAEWEKLRERSAERFGEDSVFGEGTLSSRLAVVGEAPGKQEVEEGHPFVGNAGKLLDELLEEAGIDRSKVYVTNVVKVRPTKEGGGRTQNRPPQAGEIREDIEVLREELGFIKPEALVLLGSTSAKALIKKSFTLNSEHGTLFDSELGLPALATYHPAYLPRLRGVGSEDYNRMRSQVVEDLCAAWERAHGNG